MASSETFQAHREYLFAIAYRMLGCASEAEDILQDSYLRWQRLDSALIQKPRSYLATLVTRTSIDRLRKLKALREDYIGPWLPQPVISKELLEDDPSAFAESISMAFLVLLERLNPIERAVFLLRESFEFDYHEIAEIVGKTEENCRQIFQRARTHIRNGRPRFSSSSAQQMALTSQFFQAVSEGDLENLISLLSNTIRISSDSGGNVSAARVIIVGQNRSARFILGVKKFSQGLPVTPAIINGQPGVIIGNVNSVHAATILDIRDQKVQEIHIVRNPEKLAEMQRWLANQYLAN